MKRIAWMVVILTITMHSAAAYGAQSVSYRVPVDAPVRSGFRAPVNPYAAGNRGIEYDVRSGQTVYASAAGVVSFAGTIGSQRYVSIDHGDGLRTTYSYLASISVRKGQSVRSGASIGRTSTRFQWGARIGEHGYLDPALLLGNGHVHLVEDKDEPQLAALHTSAPQDAVLAWLRGRDSRTCTTNVPPVTPLPTHHIAIVVGGLGSHTGGASILRVPYEKLGYATTDVIQFSYNGGNAATNPYVASDTEQDPSVVAQRLNVFLAETARANPGVPIDLYAHSLGGVIVREALRQQPNTKLNTVTTISSPVRGADLASAAQLITKENTDIAGVVSDLTHFDLNSPMMAAIAVNSPFMTQLTNTPVPDGLRALSIATRNDPVVPSTRSFWDGATNVVVSASGSGNPHSYVAGTDVVAREIGAHLAGLAPSCEYARNAAADYVIGRAIEHAQRAIGSTLSGLPGTHR